MRHGDSAGEKIAVGDRIATRRNDPGLDVADRETWTVTNHHPDGSLTVTDAGARNLPAGYVHQWVELAYATIVYGAQGETVHTAHLLVGERTGASSACVGMSRGRDHNTAHIVAETVADARRQWIEVFSCDRADLGPTHAARLAAGDVERYGPKPPHRPPVIPRPHNADQEAATGCAAPAGTTGHQAPQ
jgi:hypothetical protein